MKGDRARKVRSRRYFNVGVDDRVASFAKGAIAFRSESNDPDLHSKIDGKRAIAWPYTISCYSCSWSKFVFLENYSCRGPLLSLSISYYVTYFPFVIGSPDGKALAAPSKSYEAAAHRIVEIDLSRSDRLPACERSGRVRRASWETSYFRNSANLLRSHARRPCRLFRLLSIIERLRRYQQFRGAALA